MQIPAVVQQDEEMAEADAAEEPVSQEEQENGEALCDGAAGLSPRTTHKRSEGKSNY